MKRNIFVCTFLFIFILTFNSYAQTIPLPNNQNIKVMTFNIRYGTANDSINAWSKRKRILFKVVHDYSPDILCIQEALFFQLQELKAEFPKFKKSGAGRDDGFNAGEHSAVLFDSTRFDLLKEETFWFSVTPKKAGTMAWGAHFPRICSWIKLNDRINNRRFYVFNNHWDHQSQLSRDNSARMLIDKIHEIDSTHLAVIVAGDFNSGEDNPAFLKLLEDEKITLRDSYRLLHKNTENVGTFNQFKGINSGPKIDAILISPAFKVLSSAIVHQNENGHYPSDHFPVTTKLLFLNK